MTVAMIKKQALALEPRARLRLVQDIWDSLVLEPEKVRIPGGHRRLIQQRVSAHEKSPALAISMKEARRRVAAHLAGNRTK